MPVLGSYDTFGGTRSVYCATVRKRKYTRKQRQSCFLGAVYAYARAYALWRSGIRTLRETILTQSILFWAHMTRSGALWGTQGAL